MRLRGARFKFRQEPYNLLCDALLDRPSAEAFKHSAPMPWILHSFRAHDPFNGSRKRTLFRCQLVTDLIQQFAVGRRCGTPLTSMTVFGFKLKFSFRD